VFHFNPLCWRRWIGCWYRQREIRVVQMFQIKNENGVRRWYNDDIVPPSLHMTWFSVPLGGLYSLTCFVHDIIVFRALLASIVWCWGPNSIQTLVSIIIPLTLCRLLSFTYRIHSDPKCLPNSCNNDPQGDFRPDYGYQRSRYSHIRNTCTIQWSACIGWSAILKKHP